LEAKDHSGTSTCKIIKDEIRDSRSTQEKNSSQTGDTVGYKTELGTSGVALKLIMSVRHTCITKAVCHLQNAPGSRTVDTGIGGVLCVKLVLQAQVHTLNL
jgi:hypothetical protein